MLCSKSSVQKFVSIIGLARCHVMPSHAVNRNQHHRIQKLQRRLKSGVKGRLSTGLIPSVTAVSNFRFGALSDDLSAYVQQRRLLWPRKPSATRGDRFLRCVSIASIAHPGGGLFSHIYTHTQSPQNRGIAELKYSIFSSST